jgi:hypothetical protein
MAASENCVYLRAPKVTWRNTSAAVDVTIWDFKSPSIVAHLTGLTLYVSDLTAVLPRETVRKLPVTTEAKWVRGEADIVGPAKHLDCIFSVSSEAPVLIRYDEVKITANAMKAWGVLRDSAKPLATAIVQLSNVGIKDLPEITLLNGEKARPNVSEIPKLSAQLYWAANKFSGSTEVLGGDVAGLPVAMEDAEAKVAFAGDVVSVRNMKCRAAGGVVEGEVVADLGDTAKAEAVFTASEVDVEALQRAFAAGLDHRLTGTAQVSGFASLAGKELRVRSQFAVVEPGVDEYAATAARGEAVWEGARIKVPWAVVEAPEGSVAFAGEFNKEGMEARFSGSRLDMAGLAQRFSHDGPVGTAWVTGALSGTYKEPRIEVELAAYDMGYKDQRAEAVYARAQGSLSSVEIPQLFAYRDGAVLSFAGHASEISAEKPYARIAGQLRVAGLSIPQTLEWVGYEGDVRPSGQVEVNGSVSGTLEEPIIEGVIHLVGVEHDIYSAQELRGAVRYSADHLRLGPVHGRIQGVPVSAWAEVNGIRSDPDHALTLAGVKTGPVELSRVVVLQRYGVGLGGTASIEDSLIALRGSELVAAQADISCSALEFGEVTIQPFDLRLRTEERIVKLEPVEVGIADGRALLSASYDTETEELTGELGLVNCRLPSLFDVAGEAALAAAASDENADAKAMGRRCERLALRTDGLVSGTVVARGAADRLALDVKLTGERLVLDNKPLPEVTLACRYQPKDKRIEDIRVEAQYGQGLILAEGWAALGSEIYLVADASDLDLHNLSAWAPVPVSAAGSLQFTSVISGPVDQPVVKASVDMTDVTVEGLRFDLVSVPIVNVAEGGIDIDTLIVKRGPHEMTAKGHLPFTWDGPKVPTDQPVTFFAALNNADADTLRGFAEEYYRAHHPEAISNPWSAMRAGGRLDASVQIAGTLSQPTLAGSLNVTDGEFGLARWAGSVRDVNLELEMVPSPKGGSELRLTNLTGMYDETELRGHGQVLLKYIAMDRLIDNEWDVVVDAAGPRLSFLGGNVAQDLALEAHLRTVEPGKAELSFARGEAKLGGGKAVIEGGVLLTSLKWSKLHENDFDMTVSLDKARVKYGQTFNGLVTGRITVTNEEGKPANISGGVEISQAVVGFQADGGAAVELHGAPASAPAFVVDLRGAIAEGVSIRGGGLNLPLQPDRNAVRLTGTPQEPKLQGRAVAQQGRASLPGGFLAIKSFSVDFDVLPVAGEVTTPRPLQVCAQVMGQAERLVSEVEIDGQVFGPVHLYLNFFGELPGTVEVKASSEPPLAEEEIYAILGAEPFGGLTAARDAGTQALSERFVSLLAVGLRAGVFEPFEAQLRELLGLAEFSINIALEQPVEVRLGKYLVRNLLVSYRQSLGGEGKNQWWLAISYEVGPGTVVSYHTRDDGEERFSVGYRRTF